MSEVYDPTLWTEGTTTGTAWDGTPASDSFLLLGSGDYLLLSNGGYLELVF